MSEITSSQPNLSQIVPSFGIPQINYNFHKLAMLMNEESSSDQCFQILKVDEKKSNPNNIATTLITATKEEFTTGDYQVICCDSNGEWKKDKKIGDYLSTQGVEVDSNFIEYLGNESGSTGQAEKSTVRFFLQTRKVSQLVAKTWMISNEYSQTMDLEDRKNLYTKDLILSSNLEANGYCHSPKYINGDCKTDFLIRSDMLNYNGIRLSLLLAGQAYMWIDKENTDGKIEGYMPICESILSTYEIVYEYAWKVSWDTFYASRIDIARPGLKPNPPYYEVTMAYPPRPPIYEGSFLSKEKIKSWAYAKDHKGETDEPFPFYPERIGETYNSGELEYILPPYPYIPMSCAC